MTSSQTARMKRVGFGRLARAGAVVGVLSCVILAAAHEPSAVEELTWENWGSKTNDGLPWVVAFTAPVRGALLWRPAAVRCRRCAAV